MKFCVKYQLNPTEKQKECLIKLGLYATKLYNTDNYIRREQWKKTGKIPNLYVQRKLLNDNMFYRLLPSQTAQAQCKKLNDNYVSWFRLRKIDFNANPPMFRNKDSLSTLEFSQQFVKENNKLIFVMSRKFKLENNIGKITFKINDWKDIKGKVKTCNIVYSDNKWTAHVIYEISDVKQSKHKNIMSCDLGIINLVTTADIKSNSKIYTDRQALAVQHYFNKEIGRISSVTKTQQGKYSSNAINNMYQRKNNQINQIIHTVSKEVVKDAKKNKVGVIVVGNIKNIRKKNDGSSKNFGRINNQKLHSWSFAKLLTQIKYKAALSGIQVVTVSERDTSKTCSVCGVIKKSNRKHRGFYSCKCGNKINADVNGAVNILKTYLRENKISRSIGSVAEPLIWKCNNVVPT